MNKQRRRCPNGTRRNPITDECDPKPDAMAPKQRKTKKATPMGIKKVRQTLKKLKY